MKKKHGRATVESVPCEVCRKEVPRDQATSREATDRVLYLCGVECYEKWEPDSGPADDTRPAPARPRA